MQNPEDLIKMIMGALGGKSGMQGKEVSINISSDNSSPGDNFIPDAPSSEDTGGTSDMADMMGGMDAFSPSEDEKKKKKLFGGGMKMFQAGRKGK